MMQYRIMEEKLHYVSSMVPKVSKRAAQKLVFWMPPAIASFSFVLVVALAQ